jgi:hypothetical protein
MKHIALKSLLTTTMLAAGLSLSGCEKMPTPEEEADIKAEEDAIMAEDEANDDTEGPGEGGGGGGGGGGGRFDPMASDKNGDGKLAKDEVGGFMAERFDEIDTDKDGFITEAEIQERRKNRGGGGGGGGGGGKGGGGGAGGGAGGKGGGAGGGGGAGESR